MKYILVDGNNLAYRNKFIQELQLKASLNAPFDKDAWSFMFLNSLLKIAHEQKHWKELIVCVDSPNPWRRDIYKEYKGNRVKSADGQWEEFYAAYSDLQEFIGIALPFRVLKVKKCEADDIIGVLSKSLQNSVIISSDKDMRQCLRYKNTELYDGIKGEYITSDNPSRDLFIKLCTGDKGDNIGSIGTRIGEKTAEKLFDGKLPWTPEMQELFKRNQILIDFNYIDENIVNSILDVFEIVIPEKKRFDEVTVYEFLKEKQMNSLLDKWEVLANRLQSYCNS